VAEVFVPALPIAIELLPEALLYVPDVPPPIAIAACPVAKA